MFTFYWVAATAATMITAKYIEDLRAMYKNKTPVVQVGREVSTWLVLNQS
jgi:hypothetical protein